VLNGTGRLGGYNTETAHQAPQPDRQSTAATTSTWIDHAEPTTAEDRREAQLLAELRALGYRLAVRCTRCSQWLVAAESVAAHMGPVCRERVATDV
jgi:hypothetical protein